MMSSTEQALALGLAATETEKRRWRRLRPVYEHHCQAALSRDRFDLAMVLAVQSQFCREALEAEEITVQMAFLKEPANPALPGREI